MHDDWQPIETAPRDGTAILVMRDIWPGNPSGRAEDCNGHNTYVAAWWGDTPSAGSWVCYMDQAHDPQCPIEPTHWMPLPEPPSVTQRSVTRMTNNPKRKVTMTKIAKAMNIVALNAKKPPPGTGEGK